MTTTAAFRQHAVECVALAAAATDDAQREPLLRMAATWEQLATSDAAVELGQALEQQNATANILKLISGSSADLQGVLLTLVQSAARLCAAEKAFIFRRDGDVYRFSANHGFSAEFVNWRTANPVTLDRGSLTGRTAVEGKVVHIFDVLEDKEFTSKESLRLGGFRTMLGVPMMRDGQVEGVLALTRPVVQPFSNSEIRLVSSYADQALIAIENARLFQELQARTKELTDSLEHQTATSEVLSVISRSPTELQSVLETLAASATRLCEALSTTVLLREGDVLIPRANVGPLIASLGERIPLQPGWATGRATLDGRTIHVPDHFAEPWLSEYPEGKQMAIRYGHRATLAAPLMQGAAAIGALLLRRAQPGPFSEKQVALLETFADQAVIAIQNARLFAQLQDRTKELTRSLDNLRAAQDRLVETQKLAALGQLTAGVAHEIKNPLNFINNFAELSSELAQELRQLLASPDAEALNEASELAATIEGNLVKVVEHGRRADSIVKNMLLHSREGSGERRTIDLNAMAQESLNLAYHGARAENPSFNVRLTTALDPNVGPVDAFPQELVRVLLNLISNSFHAVHKRQRDGEDPSFEPEVTLSTRALPHAVEIRVRDNGTGMPEEVRAKIFDPFFTTKPPGEGTGLGLSLSHDIVVKQHGGRLEVDTRVGEFAEFVITLPRGAGAREANERSAT